MYVINFLVFCFEILLYIFIYFCYNGFRFNNYYIINNL